jgi:hypothetical protein
MTLLDDQLGPGEALEQVARLARRVRDLWLASAAVGATGAALVALGHGELGFAGLVAGCIGAGGSALLRSERRTLLTRLVAQGSGGDRPEVRAFAAELVSPPRRRRLAQGLQLAAGAGLPGPHEYTYVRPERAQSVRDDLLRLAAAFADQSRPVTAASAALCRRLLCEAIASPLYNPAVPDGELARTLRVIGSGFDGNS